MDDAETMLWAQKSRQCLLAGVEMVRRRLERVAAIASSETVDDSLVAQAEERFRSAATDVPGRSPLHRLTELFELSRFELHLVLLCAGLELDPDFPALCAAALPPSGPAAATFHLALAVLPEPDWGAISTAATLRLWRFIEIGAGPVLASAPITLDENILFFLLCVRHQDRRLAGILEPLAEADRELAPSHVALGDHLAATWSRDDGEGPVLQLCGPDFEPQRNIAAYLARELSLDLQVLSVGALPTAPAELSHLLRLWHREARLTESVLLVDGHALSAGDEARARALDWFIEQTRSPMIVCGRDRRLSVSRAMLTADVAKPTLAEQRHRWVRAAGGTFEGLEERLAPLVYQFNLGFPAIQAAAAAALAEVDAGGPDSDPVGHLTEALWQACRLQARGRLDGLARRIEPAAGWEDLVLPDKQKDALREIVAQVRHRALVYQTWGFAAKSSRGLGVTALFSGPSGVGKTLAAEVLALELRLDLFRIDLSSVVNKYIGETEKNLRRVFDEAEAAGAVLLFDEADALFGKRSEVKDSHDRHANIEVSYLLQRVESYAGLAILTSNLPEALDTAFLRRLRFTVMFPFPDLAQRAEIWRCVLPAELPLEGVDVGKLARLNASGGQIRNIAVNAAFRAAVEGGPLKMTHLLRAAAYEAEKSGKSLTESETRGWL